MLTTAALILILTIKVVLGKEGLNPVDAIGGRRDGVCPPNSFTLCSGVQQELRGNNDWRRGKRSAHRSSRQLYRVIGASDQANIRTPTTAKGLEIPFYSPSCSPTCHKHTSLGEDRSRRPCESKVPVTRKNTHLCFHLSSSAPSPAVLTCASILGQSAKYLPPGPSVSPSGEQQPSFLTLSFSYLIFIHCSSEDLDCIMMLTTAALILIVTSKVVLGQDRLSIKRQIYPLNMAPDSVDDQYEGCTEKIEKLVETKYLTEEIRANISGFGKVWENNTKNIPGPKDNLQRNHLIAISVYTGVTVYSQFNQDVRTGKQKYQNKTFSWHSLHFWLTQAIQTLKKTQQGCKSTYRGTNVTFEGVNNTEIRFGSFTSSSPYQNVTTNFGNESCFEIKTYYGADVSKYSQFPNQKEVLIPPYETFKVTDIRNDQKGDWCKTVFELKSTGIKSSLNCAVASVKPKKYHNVIISD
ncbi:GPI-linked NAD(P)(+)--arginine ADP-ribosyltransferase 1-like [Misgurnus anguillicaudatus]|uniref:GPI-linked NAD(P)(+)--arginine ADP-ribosyltransferase 1-like n=1 Tax=Misgurnus anguillicaudatus TaxID=75329 RepID=UPI003CCF5B38